MIIGCIQGGLANQMFQYAFYKTICELNDYKLILDLSFYNEDVKHLVQWNIDPNKVALKQFKLNVFDFDVKTIKNYNSSELYSKRYPLYKCKVLTTFYNQIEKLKPYHKKIHVVQKNNFYDEKLLAVSNNSHLRGFFQHHNYLDHQKGFINNLFELKKEFLCKDFLNLKNDFKKQNSISIHVRRGDYVALNHSCSASYYNNAIKFMESRIQKPNFVIFSDDISWCKKNLTFKSKNSFIDERYELKDYHELILMKFCKHNIISNSTFSWWGGWLNQNKNKIVIYPKNIEITLNRDLCPNNWVRI